MYMYADDTVLVVDTDHIHSTIKRAKRVATMTVLGVVINLRLTTKDHLDHLLSSCASSIHALRMLRIHGLQHKTKPSELSDTRLRWFGTACQLVAQPHPGASNNC